jgi:hypothetical protein
MTKCCCFHKRKTESQANLDSSKHPSETRDLTAVCDTLFGRQASLRYPVSGITARCRTVGSRDIKPTFFEQCGETISPAPLRDWRLAMFKLPSYDPVGVAVLGFGTLLLAALALVL